MPSQMILTCCRPLLVTHRSWPSWLKPSWLLVEKVPNDRWVRVTVQLQVLTHNCQRWPPVFSHNCPAG